MNKLKLTMNAILLPGLFVACSKDKADEEVIEQPKIEVVDGQMTPEIVEAFGRVGSPVVSPDGETIIFTLTYSSLELNKSNSEIYSIKPDGSELKRLTTTAVSENNLAFLPDGKRIAFLAKADKEGKQQLFTMALDGSDRKQASELEGGVSCFKISPDGSRVILASDIKPFNKDSVLFKGLDKTSGRVVDDLMYKHWDEWVDAIPHPFLADFDGLKATNPKDIMEGEPYECPMKPFGGAESFSWTPDGKQLVYVSRKLTGMDYAFSTDSDLYLYDVEAGTTTKLTDGDQWPGYDTDPVFSPDGKMLAWLSMATPKYESDKKRLMVMDMATKKVRDLTENWDYWPENLAWRKDSKTLLFTGYYEGIEAPFSMDVATCRIDTLAQGVCDYTVIEPLNGNAAVASRRSMLNPPELYTIADGKATQLTHFNDEPLSQLAEVKVEKRMVPTTDGKLMTTWVVYPPNFDPEKKYPALLYCQGGPQQAVSQFWSNRWNFRLMASRGYIVIAPNRRGVPGFGTEWNRQISGDYPGQNMKDYLAAVDYMKQEPYVDAAHIGALGASYGGFSVYWLAGHHEGRFAALVAHAGIFNMEAQYLETEEMWFADFDMGGAPWDVANATAQRTFANSPHKSVDKWTAPILVTVGELDYRILASQGFMAFNAAKMQGLEAEMLVFPDENHWVLQPQNYVLWQRVLDRFLAKYLKPEQK